MKTVPVLHVDINKVAWSMAWDAYYGSDDIHGRVMKLIDDVDSKALSLHISVSILLGITLLN